MQFKSYTFQRTFLEIQTGDLIENNSCVQLYADSTDPGLRRELLEFNIRVPKQRCCPNLFWSSTVIIYLRIDYNILRLVWV